MKILDVTRKTKIEWTDTTWNPVVGCHKISSGCKYCYAETMHKRFNGMDGQVKYSKPFDQVITWEDELSNPFEWNEVRRVFVCSMSDIFNKDVPTGFIKQVFEVMNNTPHYYQVLTKRSDRLKELAPDLTWTPNIWAGVSVENGDHLVRIDHLRDVPASIRYISFEPLIGALGDVDLRNIHWVIAGGESGTSNSLRPIQKEWVIPLRDQCKMENIPFFFKQWGKKEFNPDQSDPTIPVRGEKDKDNPHKPKGGHLIDGLAYEDLPDFPNHYPDTELKAEVDLLESNLQSAAEAFTNSWITIGQTLSKIKATIENMGHGKLYWQTYFDVDSFQEYCSSRLSLSRGTATQMRQGYELIQSLRPNLIGDSNEGVPTYTKLRALGPHVEKIIAKPEKYEQLIEHAFDNTSRVDLEKEIRTTFIKPESRKTSNPKVIVTAKTSEWKPYILQMEAEISGKLEQSGITDLKTILQELESLLETHGKPNCIPGYTINDSRDIENNLFAEETYIANDCCVFQKSKESFGGFSNMNNDYPLEVNGISIRSSEALFQACRFPDHIEAQKVIIAQKSPMAAKLKSKLYKKTDNRPDWVEIKPDLMRWCLRVKLAQNFTKFGDLLDSTGDKRIVELSHRKNLWSAVVDREDPARLKGQNLLGKLLMELRSVYRSEEKENLLTVEPLEIENFKLYGKSITNVIEK